MKKSDALRKMADDRARPMFEAQKVAAEKWNANTGKRTRSIIIGAGVVVVVLAMFFGSMGAKTYMSRERHRAQEREMAETAKHPIALRYIKYGTKPFTNIPAADLEIFNSRGAELRFNIWDDKRGVVWITARAAPEGRPSVGMMINEEKGSWTQLPDGSRVVCSDWVDIRDTAYNLTVENNGYYCIHPSHMNKIDRQFQIDYRDGL